MSTPFSLKVPGGEKKVLLHCCCAPCSCSVIHRMTESGIEPTVFFYNPNIYPRGEYDRRKTEVVRYVRKTKVSFIDADHEIDRWFESMRGHEEDAERGARCDLCFEMRLRKAAAYAADYGFRVFATSLGISRWKDLQQVNRAGEKAAASAGLVYWAQNWRLGGGQELMRKITEEEEFYRQRYCGCLYSLRNSLCRSMAGRFEDQPAR